LSPFFSGGPAARYPAVGTGIDETATCRAIAQKLINPIRAIHTCSLMTNETERFEDGSESIEARA
jgi:hypothetical protein